jgi:hypothetical protein
LVEAGDSTLQQREEKKRRHRLAVITLRSGESFSSALSDSSVVVHEHRKIGRRSKISTRVLSPSTFLLESFDASKWVLVQRRRWRARMAGPVERRWVRDSPSHRRQRSPSLRVTTPIHQRGLLNFKSHDYELGRAVSSPSALTHLVLNKGSMGPEPVITTRSATRVTRFDRSPQCRLRDRFILLLVFLRCRLLSPPS